MTGPPPFLLNPGFSAISARVPCPVGSHPRSEPTSRERMAALSTTGTKAAVDLGNVAIDGFATILKRGDMEFGSASRSLSEG